MKVEQLEIRDYLAGTPPLDTLPAERLDALVRMFEISYQRRGTEILTIGTRNEYVYLIRTGAVEVARPDGSLVGRFGEREWFGYRSVLSGGVVGFAVKAIEDCLVYQLRGSVLEPLIEEFEPVRRYFHLDKGVRLQGAPDRLQSNPPAPLFSANTGTLVSRPATELDASCSIREAAEVMTRNNVSALLLTAQGRLTGIATDRDFRARMVARGIDSEASVAEIMSPAPLTVGPNTSGTEALLLMIRHNIQHLPILDGEQILGMLTTADLVRHDSHHPVYIATEVRRSRTVPELVMTAKQVPNTLCTLIESGLPVADIEQTLSAIGEAVTVRLLELAEAVLGTPPVPCAWLTAGSLARREQGSHSDQDNALLISDAYGDTHAAYFEALSRFVCDGLNSCGYRYCPGEVMATNPRWRQPLGAWRGYFQHWIDTPEPKALMYASIFFDLRCVYGASELLDELRRGVLERTQENTIFLAHMAANALHFHPPLGLFRGFMLEKTGDHNKGLNLKDRGIIPIVDLARVHALARGDAALPTRTRIEQAAESHELSREGASDLRDALDLISTLRLKHQAHQIANGLTPDNYADPYILSGLERRHLKDAFDVVRTHQSSLAHQYQVGPLT